MGEVKVTDGEKAALKAERKAAKEKRKLASSSGSEAADASASKKKRKRDKEDNSEKVEDKAARKLRKQADKKAAKAKELVRRLPADWSAKHSAHVSSTYASVHRALKRDWYRLHDLFPAGSRKLCTFNAPCKRSAVPAALPASRALATTVLNARPCAGSASAVLFECRAICGSCMQKHMRR